MFSLRQDIKESRVWVCSERGGAGPHPRSVCARLVADEVTLEEVFPQYFSFPFSVSFHHCSILIHPSTNHAV